MKYVQPEELVRIHGGAQQYVAQDVKNRPSRFRGYTSGAVWGQWYDPWGQERLGWH